MLEKPEKIYTHLDGKQFVLRFVGALPIQYRIGLLSDLPSYEIWFSLEQAVETVVRHPEFNMENIFDIAAEAVSKISAIHTNRMPDTVLSAGLKREVVHCKICFGVRQSLLTHVQKQRLLHSRKYSSSPIWEEE